MVGSGAPTKPRLCGSGWAPDPGCLDINNNNNNNIIIIIIDIKNIIICITNIIICITNIIICIIINIINIIINKFLKNIINIEKQP